MIQYKLILLHRELEQVVHEAHQFAKSMKVTMKFMLNTIAQQLLKYFMLLVHSDV